VSAPFPLRQIPYKLETPNGTIFFSTIEETVRYRWLRENLDDAHSRLTASVARLHSAMASWSLRSALMYRNRIKGAIADVRRKAKALTAAQQAMSASKWGAE